MQVGLGNITDETLDLVNMIKSQASATRTGGAVKAGITTSDNLFGIPLEAPAKRLYFIENRIQKRTPRFLNPRGGKVAYWNQISAINANKIDGFVAEGVLNTEWTLTTAQKTVNYKSIDMAGSVTDEMRAFGRDFENNEALAMLVALQNTQIQEDRAILGGNITALGAPTNVLAVNSAIAGSLANSTNYYIKVSALTLQGYLNGANGINGGVDSPGETDGAAYTGWTSGAVTSALVTWTNVRGAVAYNLYITIAAGTYKYQKTVTTNSVNLGTINAGNAANVADQTANALHFNGIVAQLEVAGSGAYYKTLDGAAPTGDGAGGCVEVDAALQSIWNTARISPTCLYLNAQEFQSLKKVTIGGGTGNSIRTMITLDQKQAFQAGAGVGSYWNPFAAENIEILVSVHMPPGTIILAGERVPYPNAEVPNNFLLEQQQEYLGEIMARTARKLTASVSVIEALKVYFPAACGIVKNIIPA